MFVTEAEYKSAASTTSMNVQENYTMTYVMQRYFSIPLQVHIIVQSSAGVNMNSGRLSVDRYSND
jgi:hypothetical protein